MVDQYLQHLMALIGSNRIFASYEFMKSLPANTPIPNKHNLFCDLESKVTKARALTSEIGVLLKNASYPKALDNLQKAKRLVSDFPNIQNDIDFIEGTITHLQQSLTAAKLAAKKGQQQKVRQLLQTATNIDGRNIEISKIEKRLQKTVRKRKARNIVFTTLAVISPFLYFGYEQYSFLESNSQWNKANFYITRHEYQLAKLEMENVEDRLKNVRILDQIEKTKLLACVTNMFESSRFQQGLLGKVLHEGHYIDRTTQLQLDQIATLAQKAELNVAEKNWSAALSEYQQALHIALADENFHHAVIKELQSNILRIRDDRYAQYEEDGKVSFSSRADKADILFKEKRWSEAMDSYDHALRFARENRVSDYDVVTRISKSRHEAEINNCLENGQALLALNKEVEARQVFERIIALAEENNLRELAAPTLSREMIAKIDRNIFVGKINSLEDKAKKLWTEKKHTEALAYYQEMLGELNAHAGKFQVNITSQAKMVENAMAEINKQLVVTNQYRYLLSSYQNILRKNFNLSANINLQQPTVVFIKDENNVLIYKVTALGTQISNASAPHTKYEIDYKFDRATGAWTLNDAPTS